MAKALPRRIQVKLDRLIDESERDNCGLSMAFIQAQIRYRNLLLIEKHLRARGWERVKTNRWLHYFLDESRSQASSRSRVTAAGLQRHIWVSAELHEYLHKVDT